MKKGAVIELDCEKIVFGGQGLCHKMDKTIFVWNILPGEKADVVIYNKKKNYLEGIAVKLKEPSSERIDVSENHFLSCSPWQIMSETMEKRLKREISIETYKHIGKLNLPSEIQLKDNGVLFGYRDKMEYSFVFDAGRNHLAFFKRGTHQKQSISPCLLATEHVNFAAERVNDWLNAYKFPARSLKSLVLRGSNDNSVAAALFVKDKVSFLRKPELGAVFKGFQVYYSDPRSPASRADECLLSIGDSFVVSTLRGMQLKHGLLSFFQINIKMFEQVLDDIKIFLIKEKRLVDFYSGVGAISIPLADYCSSAVLVESNEEAVAYAKENIILNKLKNFEAKLVSTEKALECIDSDCVLILDPPRSGLHTKIIERILSVCPERIIYLSCNISTQARDLGLLTSKYSISFMRLYNFFPRTPHVEGLCVLDVC